MRALVAMLTVVAMARVASADATVPAPTGSDWLARCTMNEGPLLRAERNHHTTTGGSERFEPVAVGQRHLVLVQRRYAPWPQTVVVSGDSRQLIASFAAVEAAGVVEDRSGGFAGVLELRPSTKELALIDRDGKRRWAVAAPRPLADAAVAIVAGDVLVAALHPRIATGSALIALDKNTGALRWTADVAQLNVPHSQYWNDVALSLDENRVVMRGYEAGGCYEQIFDLATGRRLSSRTSR